MFVILIFILFGICYPLDICNQGNLNILTLVNVVILTTEKSQNTH